MSRPDAIRRSIHLVPVGAGMEPPTLRISVGTLDALAAALAGVFEVSCHVHTVLLDATSAHDPSRDQYHSTAILAALDEMMARLRRAAPGEDALLLGVTALDLFVPVLTFVFGEAQLEGRCAVVSTHRLREERYGLPPREDLLLERLAKEAVHELGHTFGLRHCPDWRCVMASTHSVERLDLKGTDFCPVCRRVVQAAR